MNAPDKVYVSIGYEAQTKPFHTSVEYIRKDVLLEWANNYLKESSSSLLDEGVDMAMKLLIDKLNSI